MVLAEKMAAEAGSGPRFSGRAQTVQALHRRFEDAQDGRGGVTLLVGDTGVGKSTLVAELAQELRGRGTRVLVGRALSLDDPPPFSLLRSAFESARTDPGPPSEESAPPSGGGFLLGFAPLLAEAPPPAPVGTEEWLLKALGVTGERVKISRDWVLAGIADQFLEFTNRGPTVLILDELQRADESSLSAVKFLAHQLQNRPLWILATSRSIASLTESGRMRLRGFEGETGAQELVLSPLAPEEVEGFLRANLPTRSFSAEEIARRHAETGGNPLLLLQVIRRMAASPASPGPSTVGPEDLDAGSQHALGVASVLGPEFTFDLLLAASDDDEDRLTEVVDRLIDRGLLVERPGEILEFPEDRLRAAAYGQLSEDDRRTFHQRTGATREAAPGEGSPRIFGLARDFYLGKVDKKSVEYNRQAAQIAERALAPDVAREFLSRALESQRELAPEDREVEAELVLELGRTTYELGRLEEAEGIFRRFLGSGLAGGGGLAARTRATLQLYLVRTLTAQGELGEASAISEQILAAPGLNDEPFVRIGAHHQLGLARYYGGQYPEALAHHEEELRLARDAGNATVIAHAQLWKAGDLAMMGQAKEAIAEARSVAHALDQLGSPGESAQGHLFLGNMLADDRSTPAIRAEAVEELAEAIRMGEKAQDPRRVGWALYHTAEVLRIEGRGPEAREKAQRAADTLGRIGDRIGQSLSIKVRGQVAFAEGDWTTAQTDLETAYELLRGRNNALNEIDVVLRLAQLASARGDREGTERYRRELVRLHLASARPDLVAEFEELPKPPS